MSITRTSAGDFGFSLRRAVIQEKNNGALERKNIVFAEPLPSCPTGLLPGDRLLEIDGTDVRDKNREYIIEVIRKSPGPLILKVRIFLFNLILISSSNFSLSCKFEFKTYIC